MVTDSERSEPRSGRRPGKRDRLVDAARELMHRQGIARTTLADIADAADVPVGNVYYYFKTKDDIVGAVVGAYTEQLDAAFAELEREHADPAARLNAFVRAQAAAADATPPWFGCPYGTVSTELARQIGAPDPLASGLLQGQLDWVERQFREMGRPDPHDLAVRLVAAWQGGAVLTSALGRSEVMAEQARRIEEWIAEVAASAPDSVVRPR